jgi:hypothetical protein
VSSSRSATFQAQHVCGPAAAQQSPDPREQFRKGKRLDQVVVGTEVQTEHPIVDPIASRQNEHRRLESALPQDLENLETAPTREHEIENHYVEQFGIGVEKAVFASRSNHHIVVLRLQPFGQRLCQLRLVLDNQDPHRSNVTNRRVAST